MNYNELLKDYFDSCPFDEPIFIEDIKEYLSDKLGENTFNKVIKSVYVSINRLVKKGIIEFFSKGVYYKPTFDRFGKNELSKSAVIYKKYLKSKDGIKGYFSGAYLFNELGLTTQIPRYYHIVTNECPNKNKYIDKNLGVVIRKPKIPITNENYKYLQAIDLLLNKDDISVEVDNQREIIFKFLKDSDIELEKLFDYALLTNSKKVINVLYEL